MIRLGLFVCALGLAPTAFGAPLASVARPVNMEEFRRRLGIVPEFATVPRIGNVTVAVLDSGFEGAGGDRPYLPRNTTIVEHYDADFVRKHNLGDPAYRKPLVPGDAHGRVLAQLAWAAAGSSSEGPRFLLLNANGPTLFRRAIRYAIEAKADVILFGGSFDGAGNYDGRGPINAAVDEAVAAGILWVNAAGNRGGMVYNGPILRGADGYLQFPEVGRTWLRLRNRLDENAVTITLTWNDYQATEDAGTEKDLDLFVEDASGNVVAKSELRQVPAGRVAGEGETRNPRERLTLTDLAATPEGLEYRIRVRARSGNFGPRDSLRILVTPLRETPIADPATGKPTRAIEFLDATRGGEIFPPADHAGVLTVGDSSAASAVGPTADGRVKPDVVLSDSTARLSNGEESTGSSNAAAYFAGMLAVLRATEPRLNTGHIRAWVRVLDREASLAVQAQPSVPPLPAFPPPPPPVLAPLPLSPNQARALRYAETAVAEQAARGLPAPGVWITSRSGEMLVTPGVLPPVPAPPVPVVQAQAVVILPRHAPWRMPSRRAIADLLLLGY